MKTETEPTRGEITRRDILARMGTGLVVLTIGGPWEAMSPAEASARGVPLRLLTAEEGRILNALAEVLLPGAGDAGVAHYVDDQLGRENPSFFLKYMDITDPYVEFYRQGLRSLDQVSIARHRRAFARLSRKQKEMLVRELSQGNPPGWSGPPGPLFYLVTRNDAVDVYYGTPRGFRRLGIPYLAHIRPPAKW
jgi:hypothetical protein